MNNSAKFPFSIYVVVLILVIAGAGVLSSCSDDGEPGSVLIYTYEAFPQQLSTLITEQLAEQQSLEVSFERYADSGGVYNQLMAERAEPRADVMIGLDTTYLATVKENELLEAYRPAEISSLERSLIVDDEFEAVAFDYGGVTLNVDSQRLENPPRTWSDLLDPSLAGSIIIMNPATSSPGRNFLLHTIFEFGVDDYLDFWRRLKPNILTITGTWFEGYGLYTEGEAPVVLSYDTSPAYHIEFENTDRYENVFLDGKAYAQIEIAGIVRGTDNRSGAEAVIDFLLSEAFQNEVPFNQFMFPVRTDVEIPDSFADAASSRELVQVNARTVAENLEAWIEEWEAVMR